MEHTRLMEKLTDYGANMRGIEDRFMGDVELYERCFEEFLGEPNFARLQDAMTAADYPAAFEAAHALKGLAGNLGLTPFFAALSELVEALRAHDYSHVDEQHKRALAEQRRLEALYAGEEPEAPTAEAAAPLPEAKPRKASLLRTRSIWLVLLSLVVVVLIIASLFANLIRHYRDNIATESASHLVEINDQIRLYIEERMDIDWRVTHSFAGGLAHNSFTNDESLIAYMREQRDVWGVSDLMVYTEDGFCVSVDGTTRVNDVASDTVYYARQNGEYSDVVESMILYTVPVETQESLNGSRIVAVSVAQNVEPFLDGMGFDSFDGAAYMYLTQDSGAVLSRLSHPDAELAFNILSYLQRYEIAPLADDIHTETLEELITGSSASTHLMRSPTGDRYVVVTPVRTHTQELRLFYFVPEAVVNRTMNGFSSYVTMLSLVVISVTIAAAVLIFLFVYRVRRQQFNAALKERERTFDLLVRNTKTAFGLFSVERNMPLYVSQNVDSVLGGSSFTLYRTQEGFRILAEGGTEPEQLRLLNRELKNWDGSSEFRSSYIRNPSAQGESYFQVQLYPIDESGREYVGIAQDVTRAHDREEAVRNALAMAERSNDAKNSFLSNMSHDIRTPMNAIVNMTNFAIESVNDPPRLTGYLQVIRESSDHLLRLVNDVLDMSRIESGQAVISAEPLDIKAELARVCDIVRPLCAARQQTLLLDMDGVRTPAVLGDQLKLGQIFLNLLSNAAKFTPDGGVIRLTAQELASLQPELATLRFTVADNGIGIAPDVLPHIFEPFVRANDTRVRHIEGTGLGLPICKSYVTAMGGSITCESNVEKGSVFTVELFFHKAHALSNAQAEPRPMADRQFDGRRCLLCEDNPTNRLIAHTILERVGFTVEDAGNGREGADHFLAAEAGHFDIIYMDIQMPVMDGYQATLAIRGSAHPQAKTIPIVAMTANVFAEDIERARVAGMNGHLGKPILVEDLIEETARVLEIGGLNQ